MMLSPFRAVFFDAGGTLLHPYPSVGEIYAAVSERHGCRAGADELESRFREAWLHRDSRFDLQSHTSEKIERAWWHSLVSEVFSGLPGMGDFEAFFDELYDLFARPECWRLYPDALDVLKALKARGVCLGMISNWDRRLLTIVEGLGLNRYFDFVLASALAGAAKPSPVIFLKALELASVKPSEAVHVGDSLEDDVHGARSAGIHAVLISRSARPQGHASGEYQGIPTVSSLTELLSEAPSAGGFSG